MDNAIIGRPSAIDNAHALKLYVDMCKCAKASRQNCRDENPGNRYSLPFDFASWTDNTSINSSRET